MKRAKIHFAAFHEELRSIAETVNTDDINSLYRALEQYIRLCADTGLLIGNNTCYMALGISRPTISTWLNGTRRAHNPAYKEFATLVKTICAAAREQYGIEGITSPLMTIWLQKQYDGFTDTPQQEDIRDPLGALPDKEQLSKMERKYADAKTMGE